MTNYYGRQNDPWASSNPGVSNARRINVATGAAKLIRSAEFYDGTKLIKPTAYSTRTRVPGSGTISGINGIYDQTWDPYSNKAGTTYVPGIWGNYRTRTIRAGGAGTFGISSIAMIARLGKNIGRFLPVFSTGLKLFEALQFASEVYHGFLAKGLAERPGTSELCVTNGAPWIYAASDISAIGMPEPPYFLTPADWAQNISLADDLTLFVQLGVTTSQRGKILGYIVNAISQLINYMELVPSLDFLDFLADFMGTSATSEDIRENAVYRVICSIIDMTFDEESQPGSESVDQDDSNALDLESILDKYFLLTADRQYNIVDVLPSSTSITICSSNIAMD